MLKKQLTSITTSLIGTMIVMLMSGCAATDQELIKQKNTQVEKFHSSTARITRAYLTTKDGSTVLKGEITRRHPGRGAIPGHLHVELLNANGKVIKDAEIGYKRMNLRSSISRFSLPIPTSFPPNNRIRITHLDIKSRLSEVDAPKSPWRNIDSDK